MIGFSASVKDGQNALDPFSWTSLSAKEPVIIWLFCGKRPVMVSHPMPLHHPVKGFGVSIHECNSPATYLSKNIHARNIVRCVCVCERVCVCVCERACVCACERACVCVC